MLEAYAKNGKPNTEQKSCVDCTHCKAKVSWWCMSEEATERRGTRIPDTMLCPDWSPIPTEEELYEKANTFSKLFKTYKSGFIGIDLSK